MIAVSRYAQSFHDVARYLERPKHGREEQQRVAWTDARNLVSSENIQDAAREMDLVARANTRIDRPVLHMSISWAPEDDPSRDQMRQVAYRVLDAIGCKQHQSVLVAHADEPYAHLHTVLSRVHPETSKACPTAYFYRTVQTTLRRSEREMGFRETPGHLFQLPGQQPPDRTESLTKKALKATRRSKEIPFQLIVRQQAEHHFDQARNWQDLHERLDLENLRLKPSRRGLVVTDGHEYAKCSSVAKDVSLRKLEARFEAAYAEPKQRTHDLELPAFKRKLHQLPNHPSAEQKRQLVQAFTRLEQSGINLPASLGVKACQMLNTWRERERQAHEIGF